MSAWIAITLADLANYLVGAQLTAINTAALASGQSDRFTQVQTDVTNRIRLSIQTCVRNRVSATAGTIPPELKGDGCYLIIAGMQGSIPSLKLTEDQKTMIDRAERRLERIAECKLAVSKPDDPLDPSEAQRGGSIELTSSTTRDFTRTKLGGL